MQSYRIGNDIPFRWPIYTGRDIDRVPFDLTGRKLTLEAISKTGKSYPIEMTTDGNIVQGTFYGKDQKAIGPYVLVLTENKDEVGMRTIDTCEFVELVDRSYKATGGSNDIIHYDVMELSGSRVATYSGVVDSELSETSANPIENRVVTKALNEIGNKTAEGLDAKLDKDAVVQESGTGTDKVMSQKAVTDIKDALEASIAKKQAKLTAGRGINISGSVISSTLDTNPFVVVSSLPATGNSEKIYLVPAEKQEEGNLTDEWIWNNGQWERLGSAKVDLTPYAKDEEVKAALLLKVDKVVGKGLSSNDYTDADKLKLTGLENYDDTQIRELIAGKANLQHQHTVADITDFPELYYDATAFFTSGAYPSDRYEELLEAVKAKKTVYATIDEGGYVSYVFFMSTANSDGSSSRVLLTTIFADGGTLYINTFVLQQSGMTSLQESITGKADKATTLAGYGIGDAYTKGEVDDALAAKAGKAHTHTIAQITDMPAIPSKTSELVNDSGFMTEPTLVAHTDAEVTIALTPNVIHHITGATAITVSSVADTFKECFLQFVSGESAPTLTMPAAIKWAGGQAPTLEAGMTYQISVVKLCAVCVGYKELGNEQA